MKQSIGLVSLLLPDYDEAFAYFVDVLGFSLIEDTAAVFNDRWGNLKDLIQPAV